MKLNFGKRVLLFLHWLASLLTLAYIALTYFNLVDSNIVSRLLCDIDQDIALIIWLAVYLLLAVAAVCIIFKSAGKRSQRSMITMDSSETGRVRIAVSAIEQMARQAVSGIDGVAEMKIAISQEDDALAIHVAASVISGLHVPTVTANMQRSIRQYIEVNCGVAVRDVSISVQSVISPDEPGKKGRRAERSVQAASPAAPVAVQPEPVTAIETQQFITAETESVMENGETEEAPEAHNE